MEVFFIVVVVALALQALITAVIYRAGAHYAVKLDVPFKSAYGIVLLASICSTVMFLLSGEVLSQATDPATSKIIGLIIGGVTSLVVLFFATQMNLKTSLPDTFKITGMFYLVSFLVMAIVAGLIIGVNAMTNPRGY